MTTILRGSSSTTPRRLLSNTCTGRRTIPTRVVSCRPVVWHGNGHPHHHLEYHQQQHQQHQFRYGSSSSSSIVYTSGQGWTGALGQGTSGMLTPDMSDVTEEERDNLFRTVRIEDMEMEVESSSSSSGTTTINSRVVGGAAGWGHTALIITKSSSNSSSESSSSPVVKTSQLLISGRPYDFQALLRLNRIPSFIRRAVIARSLKYDSNDPEQPSETSLIGKAIDFFFTHHDYRQDDQPQPSSYRYGIVPSFTEIVLPGGDGPAIPEQPSDSTTPSSSLSSSSSSSRSTTLLQLAYDRNTKVAASAGLTAIIGQSGTLYTFGINLRGQCGTGQPTVNHVWEPTPLRIDPYSTTNDDDEDEDDTTFVSVALGLQHGLAISNKGTLYAWGKGTRGQLGILLPDPNNEQQQQQQEFETEYSYDKDSYKTEERPTGNVVAEFAASRVTEFHLPEGETSLSEGEGERVRCIGAGFNHSAAVTESNHAWIWGKNTSVQPPPPPSSTTPTTSTNQSNQQPQQPSIQRHQYTKDDLLDTHSPTLIQGLPPNIPILDISCGSHHTSILLGDGSIYAVGVPTDTTEVRRDGGRPIVDRAVEIVPKGIVEWPVWQFESHFDRTTVVFGDTNGGGDGDDGGGERRVVEVQLWSTEELRGEAVFEPVWVEDLMRKEGRDVEMVHRGWLHTVIVAKDRLEECK